MYTQQRPRRFAPLSGGPGTYPDQHLRVSDAERQVVADRLAGHFADGRLDQAEFDERMGRAMGARTRADLAGLMDDLPGTGAPAGPPAPRRRRRPVRSFLAIVLILIIVSAAAHAAVHLAAALLWAGLLMAVLIVAARAVGRSRARHDQ